MKNKKLVFVTAMVTMVSGVTALVMKDKRKRKKSPEPMGDMFGLRDLIINAETMELEIPVWMLRVICDYKLELQDSFKTLQFIGFSLSKSTVCFKDLEDGALYDFLLIEEDNFMSEMYLVDRRK